MFDDSKRLDALEGQMKAVEKSAADAAALPAEIEKVRKWAEGEFSKAKDAEDNRGRNQNTLIEEVEKGALATAAELKKALQRIAALEQQVKKLSK